MGSLGTVLDKLSGLLSRYFLIAAAGIAQPSGWVLTGTNPKAFAIARDTAR